MFNSNIKNLLTKKVTIVFLVFILALIFIYPKITNSQETSLAVSANEYELVSGEKATITIETKYATAINKSVALSVENNNEALKQKSCVFKSDGVRVFCQVEFNSTTFGSFYVEAKYLTYTAKNTKPIIVSASCPNGDEVLTNGQCTKCVSPQIPNETKTSCITPTSLDGDSTQNSNSEDGTQSSNSTDTTYSPLARLPGLEEPIDTSTSCAFGNYLNIMIKLIIGLAAVMAMVMITMGGIEYMTSELISGKEAGKETVQHALLGLVLALSAYLILNTINPKLLNACLDNLPEAVIEIEEAPPTASEFSLNETIPTGSIGTCTEGITKINTSGGIITLCSTIANQVKEIVNKAWEKGIKLSGWGWRSNKRQIELRTINGCPDIYKSPPSKCRIPTAIPGTSMHESGLAIDFTCDGISIQTRDNKCYLWLKENLNIHKLKNLKSEAWHWSTNGK